MKIKISCSQCDQNIRQAIEACDFVELNTEGVYEVSCPYGHKYKVFLQNPHYDILFESGITACNFGFNKEAVSSLASSIERFYEFYIDYVCVKHNLSHGAASKAWKMVSSQSERQLGAFIFLYLLETNREPQLLEQKMVEFRNKVIHKGYFPTNEMVLDFAENIANIIVSISREIKKDNTEQFYKAHIFGKSGVNENMKGVKSSTLLTTCLSSHEACLDIENYSFSQSVRRSAFRKQLITS